MKTSQLIKILQSKMLLGDLEVRIESDASPDQWDVYGDSANLGLVTTIMDFVDGKEVPSYHILFTKETAIEMGDE